MRQHHRFLLTLAIVAALCITLAQATQVRPVDLGEMTERADRIFIGRCVDIDRFHDTRLGLDVTRVTFEVEQSVKGAPDREVATKLLSGSGTRQTAIPDVRFREGEEFLLFLYPDSNVGLTGPVGLFQGHFPVVRDKEGNRKIALRSTHILSRAASELGLSEAERKRDHVAPEQLLSWSAELLDARRDSGLTPGKAESGTGGER